MMKSLLTLVLLLYSLAPAHAAEKVALATLAWEPYIGESLENNGYVAEVVTEAFKRGGFEVEFQFHQWTRTVGLAKKGEVDGYLPEYYAEEVKEYASFSEPFQGGPLGFFKLKAKDIAFTSLQDLKGLKIGIVQGYANTKEFDAADYLSKDAGKDDQTNFKKLVAGRVDLVVADKYVGMQILKKEMPEQAGAIEFLPKALEEKSLYVCIAKKSPRHDALLAAFDKGLADLKADGTFAKILAKHGF